MRFGPRPRRASARTFTKALAILPRAAQANPNASYYDIRKFFQGVKVDAKGKEKMNATSSDADYNERLAALKSVMKKLAAKIEPKVYEYGFLRK